MERAIVIRAKRPRAVGVCKHQAPRFICNCPELRWCDECGAVRVGEGPWLEPRRKEA